MNDDEKHTETCPTCNGKGWVPPPPKDLRHTFFKNTEKKIQKAREDRGLNFRQLAILMGTDPKAVRKLERGLHISSISTFFKAMTALDMPLHSDFDEYLKLIGKRIQRKRKSMDIEKEELSYKAGCSLMTIFRIERGQTKFGMAVILSVAQALDMSIEELLMSADDT